jgi:hypothetical protein
MPVKSQQDIKNATKEKSERVPKSMERKVVAQSNPDTKQPEKTEIERIVDIERYCLNVDKAFAKLADEVNILKAEIVTIKSIIPIVQGLDAEISKLTGDSIRMTKLEEDRYVELANAINKTIEKIDILDKSIPSFVDDKINAYFEELAATEIDPDSNQPET